MTSGPRPVGAGTSVISAGAGGLGIHLLPALTGAFLGGPLVARELQDGTARFAWTQGHQPERWLTGKLIRLALPLAAAAAAVGMIFQWRSAPLEAGRLSWQAFGLYAPVFAGWTVASLTLGVFLGTALRDSTLAIVLTLLTTAIVPSFAHLLAMDFGYPRLAPGSGVPVPPGAFVVTATSYQPPGRCWAFQFIEAGSLLAVSLLLAVAAIWLVRRRSA